MNDLHVKIFMRFGCVVVIIALFYLLTHGLGANPKNYSEIKASIKMLLADEPVGSDQRLHVATYFNHRFSDSGEQILGFNPLPILQQIRIGGKLNDENKKQLSKMLESCSELTSQ